MTDVSTNALTNADYAPDGTAVTTSGTPFTADPNIRAYIVTSGGTAGDEFIDLPKFPLNGAGINAMMVGQRVTFYVETQTDPADAVKIRTNNGADHIPMYGAVQGNPAKFSISGAAVLDYSGALATFIWGGDQWLIDQILVDFNNDSPIASTPCSITVSDTTGSDDAGSVTIAAGSADSGAGGDVAISAGDSASGAKGHVKLTGLPTVDPHIVNALWKNSGVLTVSAG